MREKSRYDSYLKSFYIDRRNMILVMVLVLSYLIYSLQKTYQKAKEEKWFQKKPTPTKTAQDEEEGIEPRNPKPKVVFNNQPWNPEVFNVDSYLIVLALLCSGFLLSMINLYVENFFPIFMFFASFLFSVVCPSIIYATNSGLRDFVKEMYFG